MVKIIKNGSIKHTATCDYCGCEFSFEAEDVTKNTVWDDHGGHYPAACFYEINCPFCTKKIRLNDPWTEIDELAMRKVDT